MIILLRENLNSKIFIFFKKGSLGGTFTRKQHTIVSAKDDSRKEKLMARGLPKVKPIQGVNQILLVSSGKGGVGKSTIAVNLATALKVQYPSKNIGLLDADVFGPSIPLMMGLHDSPLLTKDNKMEPLVNYGVKCMSLGFLMAEGAPVIWRGLMVMQALEKLMRQVFWDSIDYLIVDTPPGTGDTHLSLVQNIPIAGTILVTTPQAASIQVTRRGAIMFQKLNVPIMGIVENMSYVKCTNCKENINLFGQGTAALAKEFNTTILQSFPLDKDINSSAECGKPVVLLHKENAVAFQYNDLAKQIVKILEKNVENKI